MAEIAAMSPMLPRLSEFEELTAKVPLREASIMRFFGDLDAGTRAALVGNSKDEDIYHRAHLARPTGMNSRIS